MSKNKSAILSTKSSQAGFTLIESLLAIVVVAVMLAAVAPVIVIATATRVQSRRVELATQAARTYIDGVRSGAITAPNHLIALAPTDNRSVFITGSTIPSTVVTCATSNAYCSDTTSFSLYCIDLDNTAGCTSSSLRDMVVQSFRGAPSGSSADRGYLLGVRVYRADALKTGTTLIAGTKKSPVTGWTGLSGREAPLVELTTEISTNQTGYKDYCARLGCPP